MSKDDDTANAATAAPGGKSEIDLDILDGIIGYSLRRAQYAIYQDYARTVGSMDVRPAQFAALSIIGANPGLSQTTLATTMGIDRSGAVTLIDALEEKNLAMRVPSPTDRRTHAIMLTAKGQTTLVKLKELVAEHDDRVTEGFTKEERFMLIDMLRRLYQRG